MSQALLSVRDLKKYFPIPKRSILDRERRFLRANDGVSMEVCAGETYGLVGESGCGKSTFGKAVLQLERPTHGEVIYHGNQAPVDLTKCKGKALRSLRKDLQIVFQDPYSSLNPRMTVGRIIEEGVATHGFFKRGSEEMRAYILEMMKKCGLQGYMAGRYPHQFSGGQRQRICIARALAVRPKFVVCDECVSALDVSIQSQILNLLTELKQKEGLTYLFISHDLSVVRYISDRIGVMYLGRIVEEGRADEVFENPRHPYTLALISAIPTTTQKQGSKILLSGNMPSPISPPSGCPFHTRCFMSQEICKRVPALLEEVEEGHFCACHFSMLSSEEKRKIAKENVEI
jgi:oligopeptide/dipeptide ABC transporter ATP-binding protein